MESYEGMKPASVHVGTETPESMSLQQEYRKGGTLGERLAALPPDQLGKIDRTFFLQEHPGALRHIVDGTAHLYERMLMAINSDSRVSVAQVQAEIEAAIEAALDGRMDKAA